MENTEKKNFSGHNFKTLVLKIQQKNTTYFGKLRLIEENQDFLWEIKTGLKKNLKIKTLNGIIRLFRS